MINGNVGFSKNNNVRNKYIMLDTISIEPCLINNILIKYSFMPEPLINNQQYLLIIIFVSEI
jgi:hypothetical protein